MDISSRRLRRRIGAALAMAGAASVPVLAAGAPAGAAPPVDPPTSGHGITVVDWQPVDLDPDDPNDPYDPLLYDAHVTTDAVFTPATAPDVTLEVRIYLPDPYDPDRAGGYPVLYLLHGGGQTYRDWSESGDVLGAIEDSGYEGIVVMPEGGLSGWYHDWVSNTRGGFRPLWETFHVDQLVPWVDANFNTDAQPASRAIAGLSMGGSGALKYAVRHPSVFGEVASFSGGPDIFATHDGDPSTGTLTDMDAAGVINTALVAFGASIDEHGRADTDPAWRDYRLSALTQEQRLTQVFGPRSGWAASNPQDLAEAGAFAPFDGDLAIYTGQDDTDYEPGRWNTAFHDTLVAQGVDHRFCKLPGNHDWRYWHDHVTHFMTTLAGNPAPACPTTIYP